MIHRAPLGRARGLGSARCGANHWWLQRVTAVALVPLTIWFIFSVVRLIGADHQTATDWLVRPLNAVLMLLLIVSIFHHMQLGLQVVIEDYIHNERGKITGIVLVRLFTVLLAVLSTFTVLKIGLGG